MESHMIDYYNDEPQIVHIINKQNEEFAEASEVIKRIDKENKHLREVVKKLDKLKAPSVVESGKDEDGHCILEDKLIDICLEICGGDDEDDEPLSMKLLEDYTSFRPGKPLHEGSIIKRFVDELNEVTGHQKPDWCLTKVIAVCESMGYDDEWLYPGDRGPRIDIYNFTSSLSDFRDFSLPTVHTYVK